MCIYILIHIYVCNRLRTTDGKNFNSSDYSYCKSSHHNNNKNKKNLYIFF